jgi:hypothetical protein
VHNDIDADALRVLRACLSPLRSTALTRPASGTGTDPARAATAARTAVVTETT